MLAHRQVLHKLCQIEILDLCWNFRLGGFRYGLGALAFLTTSRMRIFMCGSLHIFYDTLGKEITISGF